MRLATVKADGRARIAFVDETRLVFLDDAYSAAGMGAAPLTILALLEAQDTDRLAAAYAAAGTVNARPLAGIEWLPPVKGFKILSVAINNAGVARLASVVPANPPFFLKPPSAMIGHSVPIVIHPDYGLTHPEAELAVVIGRHAKNLSLETALDAVFGYTIINDITSITLKSEDTYVFPRPASGPTPPGFEHGDMQLAYHARSKGTDTFAPIGPVIVSRDEIADPNRLGVRVFMGEEEVTSDNTSNLRYSVEEVLVWASRYFTLEPGDIVHMGTAAAGRYSLRELDLQCWDGPLAIEIEGIGRLSNPIRRVSRDGLAMPARRLNREAAWPPRYTAGEGDGLAREHSRRAEG